MRSICKETRLLFGVEAACVVMPLAVREKRGAPLLAAVLDTLRAPFSNARLWSAAGTPCVTPCVGLRPLSATRASDARRTRCQRASEASSRPFPVRSCVATSSVAGGGTNARLRPAAPHGTRHGGLVCRRGAATGRRRSEVMRDRLDPSLPAGAVSRLALAPLPSTELLHVLGAVAGERGRVEPPYRDSVGLALCC